MHKDTIESFYAAFGARDGARMAAAYHAEAHFSDPVFVDLRGRDVGLMWRMLCERAVDLTVDLVEVRADASTAEARWEARYTYSASRRPVHNVVSARFRFDGDLIVDHRDTFDLWRWTRMALGPVGTLMGWSPLLQGAVRKKAMEGLRRYRDQAAS